MFENKRFKVYNAITDKLMKKLDVVISYINKEKYSKEFEKAQIDEVTEFLKDMKRKVDNLGQGPDSDMKTLEVYANKSIKNLDTLKEALNSGFLGHVEDACKQVKESIYSIVDYLEEDISDSDEFDEIKEQESDPLYKKLDLLNGVKNSVNKMKADLEKQIQGIEKDQEELEMRFISELNTRKKQDLYNRIEGKEKSVGILNEKSTYYSKCISIIDAIYEQVSSLVSAGRVSAQQEKLAKDIFSFLKPNQLLDKPKELVFVLNKIEKELKGLFNQGPNFEATTVSSQVDEEKLSDLQEKLMKKYQSKIEVSSVEKELEELSKKAEIK